MEEIDIKDFLNYLKEKILYIIASVLLFIIIVLVYSIFIKVPKYSTYTTIALVKANDNTTYNQSDYSLNKGLVTTYSVIVKSKKVLDTTIEDLKLDYSRDKLAKEITVSSPDETQLIKISVEDPSSKRAYNITKSISKVFTDEVASTYEMNNIRVIEEPEINNIVSNYTLKRDLLLAIIVGVFISSGILFIIYYFDDTIKYHENIEDELGLPVLAKVFKSRLEDLSKSKKVTDTELILSKYPKSVVSESVKTLRTNLEFSSIDKTIRTILITSSVPGEGKSFISTNLAISFAQANKRVLLIDCDMRKGRVHKIFKVNNNEGYSNLLLDDITNFKNYMLSLN